ncbi:response regulator transcription factor [Saccharopolyspora sp. NPDC002578]
MTDQYPIRLVGLKLEAEPSGAELEVAQLLACGLTNDAIAEALCRSEHTVKTHLRRLMHRTGTTSRSHLVIWMYEAGYLLPGLPGFPARPRPPEIALPSTSSTTRGTAAHHVRGALLAARRDLEAALTHLGTL